ncbi:MAG: hypothetical protein KDA24_29610 [Deltaproteobacteria bacterium]|nr:hypothetical protein [Deltaproteobacteria bacterium]
MIARFALPLAGLLLLGAGSAVATDAPPLDALVGRVSMSLGGPTGGLKTLEGAPAIELVFRRTVRDSHSAAEITADHRYVEVGAKRRIDVRVVDGDGTDSAAIVSDSSWMIVDGATHTVEATAVEAQMGEFGPRRLWSVPFALASEGREILNAASLEVVGRGDGESGSEVLVMVGKNEEGEETSRVEVDAKSYRPTNVQFVSSSGKVEYRYGDYREIADGLVVPFSREFLRNGSRVSRTDVTSLSLRPPKEVARLFDEAVTKLSPLPVPKGISSRD